MATIKVDSGGLYEASNAWWDRVKRIDQQGAEEFKSLRFRSTTTAPVLTGAVVVSFVMSGRDPGVGKSETVWICRSAGR